ncbi:MAG: cupin domain-containing protein [Anaerolineales bacterium]
MSAQTLSSNEGKVVLNGFVRFMLYGGDTGGSFSLVEHVMQPGTLAAPMHTHCDEDEYSYVLEGEITAKIGDDVIRAPAGTLVSKPRNIPHTFWNQGSTPARLLEIISPAGFENYFEELAAVLEASNPPDFGHVIAVAQKYNLEMDFSTLMDISQKYNVWLGGPNAAPKPDPNAEAQPVGEPL